MMAAFPFEFPPPDSRPVGYGFRPTEEELISYYLHHKMLGNESLVQSIPVVDLYNHEPHQLPELSTSKSDNHEWFFFQPDSNTETKTTTSTGKWKYTGKPRKIMARGTNDVIGTRKILVFRQGEASRTRWILHEYRLQIQHTDLTHPYKSSFRVCRLKENAQHVSTCDSSHLKRKATERVTHLKPNQQLEHQSLNLVHSETQPAIGASVFEPDTDSSYSEPQLSSINFQSVNAYANGEIPMQPDANDVDFILNKLERFLLSPCTPMPDDALTWWLNELQNLVQGPAYIPVDHQPCEVSLEEYHQPCDVHLQSLDESLEEYVYHQSLTESLEEDVYHQSLTESLEHEVVFQSLSKSSDDLTRWWNEDESLPRESGIYVLQAASSSDDEPETFPKSNDLESYARRILLFIVNATRILLFIVKAISQYKAKEGKKVVGPTSQISITDSSNGQKSEGGNKYGCIDSTTKHIQQEQDTTNVPSVDDVIAFLAIIMLVLSVCILLQRLWERVLKMMQGRRGRYLFVALLSCAAVWWKSG